MKKLNRGQSSLEYLMTYGWAILAVVIIAGVLWYLGIFNPGQFAGEKQCAGFSAFTCQDFRMNTSGVLTIVLNNKLGGSLTAPATCSPTTVGANSNTTCTLTGFPTGTVGSTFSRQTVSLNYTDLRSGLTHTDSGVVAGKYE